jgi:hypothetical protein
MARLGVEPVPGVESRVVVADVVEEHAEAALGAGDGDQEGRVDPIRLAGVVERLPAAGQRRAFREEVGVDLRG